MVEVDIAVGVWSVCAASRGTHQRSAAAGTVPKRVSQGKEQTVLGESALSRYSDLSLKAYSQSVSRRVGDRSLDRSNCVYSPFEGDYTTIKIVKETSTVIESHMGQ